MDLSSGRPCAAAATDAAAVAAAPDEKRPHTEFSAIPTVDISPLCEPPKPEPLSQARTRALDPKPQTPHP